MQKIIWAIIALIIVAGGFWWWQASQPSETAPAADSTQQTPSDTTQTPTQPSGGTTAAPTASLFTMAQVTTHNSATSCWSIIDGNVYDLTAWISKHPGGERAILGLCGKDGTAAFHGQHGDAKRQADILATMKMGALAQ